MSELIDELLKSPRCETNEISIQVGLEDYLAEYNKSDSQLETHLTCKKVNLGHSESDKRVDRINRCFPPSTKIKRKKQAFINRIHIQEVKRSDYINVQNDKVIGNHPKKFKRMRIVRKKEHGIEISKLDDGLDGNCRLQIGSCRNLNRCNSENKKIQAFDHFGQFLANSSSSLFYQPKPKLYNKYLSPYSGSRINSHLKIPNSCERPKTLSRATNRKRYA